MKNITQKSHRKRNILISAIVLAALLIGYVTYAYINNGSIFGWPIQKDTQDTFDLKPATDEQIKSGQDTKKHTLEQDQEKSNETENKTSEQFNVTVSASNKSEQSFQVRVLVDKLVQNGSCTISLRKGESNVIKTAPTQTLANSSTCQGFDIALDELASGSWDYIIEVIDSDKTKGSVNGKIDI